MKCGNRGLDYTCIVPEFSAFVEEVQSKWTEFSLQKFTISYEWEGKDICLCDDSDFALYILRSKGVPVNVKNCCKGFSSFNLEESLSLANVKEIVMDNSKFTQDDFDVDDCQVATIISHTIDDLVCRIPVFGPIDVAQETSVREFIGPVLLAAVRIAKEVKIQSELNINGSCGNGPVDYALLYKDFCIVITEAEKDDLLKGLTQNLAQVASAREDY